MSWIYIIGAPNTGKTTLALDMVREAMDRLGKDLPLLHTDDYIEGRAFLDIAPHVVGLAAGLPSVVIEGTHATRCCKYKVPDVLVWCRRPGTVPKEHRGLHTLAERYFRDTPAPIRRELWLPG